MMYGYITQSCTKGSVTKFHKLLPEVGEIVQVIQCQFFTVQNVGQILTSEKAGIYGQSDAIDVMLT